MSFLIIYICQSSLVSFEVTFNRATIPQTQWRGSLSATWNNQKNLPLALKKRSLFARSPQNLLEPVSSGNHVVLEWGKINTAAER